MSFKKKKNLFIFVILTLIIGVFMYTRFSNNNKGSDLYNPDLFSFKGETYHVSDAMPYIKYYQALTGKKDDNSIRYGIDTYIKNEVIYAYIQDLQKTPSGDKLNFTVTDQEIVDTIHKTPIFLVENEKTKEKEFSPDLYKNSLSSKGIETSFFEKELKKELTIGKFLNRINELTIYNKISKEIALNTTLNTRIIDTLKVNYSLIPVSVSDEEMKGYYEKNKNTLRKENLLSIDKYTFTDKNENHNKDQIKAFSDELSKLEGNENINSFINNSDYYSDSFEKNKTQMDLKVSELTKLLNLTSLNIKNIPKDASFIDESGSESGTIILYHVTKEQQGDFLTYEESINKIRPILEHTKQESELYSQTGYLKSIDFSKVNIPYLSYERIVINPLLWKGDDKFLEASYQLARGEIALMTNDRHDQFVKLVNIEPITLKDDEKEAFNYGQEDGYKNSVLNLFYEQIKEIYNYNENNLPERIKDFK
jgi:hypothetical protein